MMHDLYICSGKYHLFCALLLKMIDNVNRGGDLLICDCFEGAQEIYDTIITQNKRLLSSKTILFDNVILLPKGKCEELAPSMLKNNLQKILKVIQNKSTKPRNRVSEYINSEYERIYIAGGIPFIIEYCLYLYYKKNSKIFFFDDGLGPRMQWEEPKFKERLFDLIRCHEFTQKVTGKYFFSPDRVCDIYPYVPIVNQCKPNRKEIEEKNISYEKIVNILNESFNYSSIADPFKSGDIVYFSAGYDLYSFLEKYSNTECEIVNYIGKHFDNVSVKRHPNSKEKYSSKLNILGDTCMPEILYLNNDIENKLLISSASTTVFNPSFVFDKNPFIILTYKLFGDMFTNNLFKCNSKELDKRIARTLLSGYADKSKIYIPSSLEELEASIEDYKSRTKI